MSNMPSVPEPDKTSVLSLDYKTAAMLSYLPVCGANLILSIVWLVTEPKSNAKLRFYAMQQAILSGSFIVLGLIVAISSLLLGWIPIIGALVGLLGLAWMLAVLAYIGVNLYGMYQLYQGSEFRIPYIADMAEQYSK